ncbi:MAG: 50S ribosomal protein L4 [Bacilli bacterium]|nr:50S ribosomal protein L4 [Bacilli bacterium]
MAEKKISLKVLTLEGAEAGTVDVSAAVFGVKANDQVIHDAVTVYLANCRQDTAKAKKRHEVHGTNKKPWRQKGTGRARSGDCKSPVWVGGGIVWGPDGRQNHKLSQNKKEHALALKGVLSEKAKKGIVVVDSLKLDKISTKEFVAKLDKLGLKDKKVLLVTDEENENLILSARNVPELALVEENNIAVYDVLKYEFILISKESIKKVEEALK